MKTPAKPAPRKLINVRVPPDVAEALTADAKRRKRSVNAQINLLIERHLKEAA